MDQSTTQKLKKRERKNGHPKYSLADILGMTLDFLQTTNTFDRIGQYFIVPSGVVQRYVKYGILILMKAVSNI